MEDKRKKGGQQGYRYGARHTADPCACCAKWVPPRCTCDPAIPCPFCLGCFSSDKPVSFNPDSTAQRRRFPWAAYERLLAETDWSINKILTEVLTDARDRDKIKEPQERPE